MKLPKFNKHDVVEVEWIDSNYDAGWHNADNYQKSIARLETDFIIRDVGYFMEYSKSYIVLTDGYDSQERPAHYHLNAIPKAVVRKIRKLKYR